MGQSNCVFVLGMDVSGSTVSNGVLESSIKVLTDAARYLFAPGDKVIVVPWDSVIRKDRIVTFDCKDDEDSISEMSRAFENLESLVNPKDEGSNLMDARGYCTQQALRSQKESNGALLGVVLIFTDIRLPDMEEGPTAFKPEQISRLRKELAGSAQGDFDVHPYQAEEKSQIILHSLVGKGEGVAAAKVDRTRVPTEAAPKAAEPPPPPPPDTTGARALFIILSVVCLLALIGLPFAWRHQLAIGDVRETVRAVGGRMLVKAGQGISPRGSVYVPVRGLQQDQVLLSIEGRGPQLIAVARQGVRLNDGNPELPLPLGKPFTLRVVVDGVPGEQTLELQTGDFFGTNAGPIIGMALALLVIIACIIA